MGSARYKTSSDGCFRLYVQQTSISGNNAVLSAWIAVKNSSVATVQSISNPKITIGSTSRTGSTTSVTGASDWKTVYSISGITAPYTSGSTGGSVQVSASGSLYFNGEDGGYWYSESVSAWYDLDTRSVAGTISATNAAIGSNPTFTISGASSGMTYKITYSCGSESGTVVESTSSTTYNSWSIPASLGNQMVSSSSASITYTLTTMSGSSVVGTASTNATVTVPSYSYSIGGNITVEKGTYSTIGAFVAGKTSAKITLPTLPTGLYGATISHSLNVTIDGSSIYQSTAYSGAIYSVTPSTSGILVATVTSTDSRGKTVSKSSSQITYAENTAPTATVSAYRSATSGSSVQSITGQFYYVLASGTYNNITNNACTMTIKVGSSTTSTTGSGGTVSKTASGSLSASASVDVTVTVTDSLGNVATATATIPQGFAVVQFGTGSDHHGVSIGKVGQVSSAGTLEVAYRTDFDDDVYIKGVKVTPGGGGSGTITGVSVNGTSVATSGVANITSVPASILSGAVSAAHGGTGQTSLSSSASALINALSTGASTPTDDDYYVSQYVGGGTTTTTYHRRPVSALWEYIKGKISSVLGLTATSYGGKAASATSADSATRATTASSASAVSASPDAVEMPASYTVSYAPGQRWLSALPFPRMWHDHSAFLHSHTIINEEKSADGTTWVSDDRNLKPLFNQKEHQTIHILKVDESAFRFTIQSGDFSYSQISWIGIGVGYSSPFSAFDVTVESSSDGTSWATAHNSYCTTNSNKIYLLFNNPGSFGYVRFTFAKRTNITTGTVDFSCMEMLAKRPSSQGHGKEYESPIDWNDDRDILPYGNGAKNLGLANRKWKDAYAITFHGALDGNATSATSATTASKLGSSTVGSTSKPVYLNGGTATECSTYAGGTAVTLNGSGKGGSTASFYAPTSAGTSGQVLTSSGGAPGWTNASGLSVGSASKLGSSTVGSTSKPVYLNGGTATECSTYAGGTAVTLNGSGKGGSTASFYAPTGAGTSGQVLTSTGGTPTWSDISPTGQTITAVSLTASAINSTTTAAICTLTNRSYKLSNTEVYINVQCVLSSGVSLAGNDWWRLVRDFPMPKGATASASDMGVSLNAVLYQSNGDYAGQVDAHIAYHTAETNRPAGWYLRVHTNVQLTAGMKVIASGSYLI